MDVVSLRYLLGDDIGVGVKRHFDAIEIQMPGARWVLLKNTEDAVVKKLTAQVESVDTITISCHDQQTVPADYESSLYWVLKLFIQRFQVRTIEYLGRGEPSIWWAKYRIKLFNVCLLTHQLTIQNYNVKSTECENQFNSKLKKLPLFRRKCYRLCDLELPPLTFCYFNVVQFEHDSSHFDKSSVQQWLVQAFKFETLDLQVNTFLLIANRLQFHKDATRLIVAALTKSIIADFQQHVRCRPAEY